MKSIIEWVSCEKMLPNVKDDYLVLIKQKYDYEKEWEYYIDVGTSFGDYIDGFWDTYNDWIEGQETHVIYWAKFPSPIELIERFDKNEL